MYNFLKAEDRLKRILLYPNQIERKKRLHAFFDDFSPNLKHSFLCYRHLNQVASLKKQSVLATTLSTKTTKQPQTDYLKFLSELIDEEILSGDKALELMMLSDDEWQGTFGVYYLEMEITEVPKKNHIRYAISFLNFLQKASANISDKRMVIRLLNHTTEIDTQYNVYDQTPVLIKTNILLSIFSSYGASISQKYFAFILSLYEDELRFDFLELMKGQNEHEENCTALLGEFTSPHTKKSWELYSDYFSLIQLLISPENANEIFDVLICGEDSIALYEYLADGLCTSKEKNQYTAYEYCGSKYLQTLQQLLNHADKALKNKISEHIDQISECFIAQLEPPSKTIHYHRFLQIKKQLIQIAAKNNLATDTTPQLAEKIYRDWDNLEKDISNQREAQETFQQVIIQTRPYCILLLIQFSYSFYMSLHITKILLELYETSKINIGHEENTLCKKRKRESESPERKQRKFDSDSPKRDRKNFRP